MFINRLLVLLFLLLPFKVYAIACTTNVGTFPYNFDFIFDSNQNNVGYMTPWSEQTASGSYIISSPCSAPATTYYSGRAADGLIEHSVDSNGTWYTIPGNPYLAISMEIGVFNHNTQRTTYQPVPFSFISNNCNGYCGNGPAGTGSKVRIRLKILEKFIGKVHISRPIAYLYGNQGSSNEALGSPLVQINLTTDFVVPQSCSFDIGDIVTFDFGGINSSSFVKGGINQIPQNVDKITKKLKLECNGIDGGALLTMRTEASNATGDHINSSNIDIGFKIAAVNNGVEEVFIPNDITNKKSIQLNNQAQADIILKAWPISTTGNRPEVGLVTAEGYLRIDYQ